MKKFRNEDDTVSLYVGKFYDILDSFNELTRGSEHYYFGSKIPYWFACKYSFKASGSQSLALLVDCDEWALVESEELKNVIQSNELKLVKEFTMPKTPLEWVEALSEFMKVGHHGVGAKGISPLLSVFGKGQPCTLIDGYSVKNLGVCTVSEMQAEALLRMRIMPIPCFSKDPKQTIEKLMEDLEFWKNESWGLHDHKGTHC